jgi:hypothetical protein
MAASGSFNLLLYVYKDRFILFDTPCVIRIHFVRYCHTYLVSLMLFFHSDIVLEMA